MSDFKEEQEMEAEALEAIFDTAFNIVSDEQPFQWSVKLLPVDCGGVEDEENEQNYVIVRLNISIPLDYPETSLPGLDIEIIKGLADEHRIQLLEMAAEEAQNNQGMPAIYAICEVLREWLADNNVKGLADVSMHAQMMRRAKETEQKKFLAEQEFEAQKKEELQSQAELEEQTVRKRREEGTPCTRENFDAWQAAFMKEMAEQALAKADSKVSTGRKQPKEKKEDKSGRVSGFLQFSKGGKTMEEMETAAAELEDEFDDDDDFDEENAGSDGDDDEEDEPDI